MPRGSKAKYSDKQKCQAEHIEEGYENRGTPKKEAERRAWATVNKVIRRRQKDRLRPRQTNQQVPAKKGGKLGGAASANRTAGERSVSAKKAARTRKARAAHAAS